MPILQRSEAIQRILQASIQPDRSMLGLHYMLSKKGSRALQEKEGYGMRVIQCAQLSETWWAARKGKPSASNFDRIITPKKREYSKAARSYMYDLIAEIRDPNPPWLSNQGGPYRSPAMANGVNFEPEARRFYELETGSEVYQVGGCETDDGRFFASPDGMIGEAGLLELKVPLLKTQAEYLDNAVMPAEYLPQVHGQLIVTGRDWVDFLSYCPGLPALLIRVVPDGFTDALRDCLERFHEEYQELRRKLAA